MEPFSYRQEVYRKAIHLSSLWMPAALWLLAPVHALIVLSVALIAMIMFELVRRRDNQLARLTNRMFAPTLRARELTDSPHITGATFMLCGAVMSALLFPTDIAATALTVLMISDSVAALIGKRFGTHRIAGKTLEGCTAFLVSAILIVCLVAFMSEQAGTVFIISGIVASIVATLCELFAPRLHIDDNLLIPLAFGFTQLSIYLIYT